MKKGIILIAAICISSIASFAQKLGHINGQELVEHMPEYKTAYEELNAYKKQYEDALLSMQAEYEQMIADFQKVEQTTPKVILDTKAQEIEEKRKGMYSFQEKASADITQEEQKKVDPVLKKAKEAIDEVAKANGYIYIFDSGTGTLLFSGGDDVTKLVCTKLGIPDFTNEKIVVAPAPATPGSGPVPPKK